jgi:hypothetical protein
VGHEGVSRFAFVVLRSGIWESSPERQKNKRETRNNKRKTQNAKRETRNAKRFYRPAVWMPAWLSVTRCF